MEQDYVITPKSLDARMLDHPEPELGTDIVYRVEGSEPYLVRFLDFPRAWIVDLDTLTVAKTLEMPRTSAKTEQEQKSPCKSEPLDRYLLRWEAAYLEFNPAKPEDINLHLRRQLGKSIYPVETSFGYFRSVDPDLNTHFWQRQQAQSGCSWRVGSIEPCPYFMKESHMSETIDDLLQRALHLPEFAPKIREYYKKQA